jgi:hypothetical protein
MDNIVFSEHAEEMDVSGDRQLYRLSEEEEIPEKKNNTENEE